MRVRPHKEQRATADNIRNILEGSEVIEKAAGTHIQDALSLRCVPQLHGAAKKTLYDALTTIETEMNSCCDNPIIWTGDGEETVISACNPDSSYVGIEMDSASIAATNLAKMSERRNNRLIDETLSGYPSFLISNPGLNSGLMIPQYTQAGLLNDMAFIGEGYVIEGGEISDDIGGGHKVPAAEVMKREGIRPAELKCKEGLSLLNGTITVTALAMIALYDSISVMKNIEIGGALVYEALRGTTKALDPRIHAMKNHEEEISSAENLLKLLEGSEISEKYRDAKVQDCYIMRAMAQIHGSTRRLVKEAYEVIMEEMHGVSDNPEIFPTGNGDGVALMCGNFDGSYVGAHVDMLSMAAAIAGNEVERSIDRMVNHNLSDGLPAFLVSKPGLNNGFMIPQYTAAGLQSEIKILAQPSTIDSISTCANQEDPVSMAYFAAKKSGECVRKLQYMVGIEFFVALQAIDFLKPLAESPVLAKVHDFARETVDFVDEDRYLYPDIEKFRDWVKDGTFIDLVEGEIGELKF